MNIQKDAVFVLPPLTCPKYTKNEKQTYTDKHDIVFKPFPNRFGKKQYKVLPTGEKMVYTNRNPYYRYKQ